MRGSSLRLLRIGDFRFLNSDLVRTEYNLGLCAVATSLKNFPPHPDRLDDNPGMQRFSNSCFMKISYIFKNV